MSEDKVILYEDRVTLKFRRLKEGEVKDVPRNLLEALGQFDMSEQHTSPEMLIGVLMRKANELGLHGFRYVTTMVEPKKDHFTVTIETAEEKVVIPKPVFCSICGDPMPGAAVYPGTSAVCLKCAP